MKQDILKKLIKESVAEVMNEMFKEILLESIRSNNRTTINENNIIPSNSVNNKPTNDFDVKNYLINQYQKNHTFTTDNIMPNNQMRNADNVENPAGEVPFEFIQNLMK